MIRLFLCLSEYLFDDFFCVLSAKELDLSWDIVPWIKKVSPPSFVGKSQRSYS